MRILLALAALLVTSSVPAGDALRVKRKSGRLAIYSGSTAVAEYVYHDAKMPRPCLLDVATADGIRVTRNHPPQAGDDQDHPHHTGIFFTFGDLNGIDFWHLRGRSLHERFLEEPRVADGRVTFSARNRYESLDGKTQFASEVSRITVQQTPHGTLYEMDQTLTAKTKLRIGSKEEGGIAIRVATPIAITSKAGGRMSDDKGRSGGKAIWGQQAAWVDYSGTINKRYVGVTVIPHPSNFSACWWHARDYGLLAANSFGPLNDPTAARIITAGEKLRLRFGVLVHSSASDKDFDTKRAVADALTRLSDK